MTKQERLLKLLEELAFIERELNVLKNYLPNNEIIKKIEDIMRDGKGYYFFPDGSTVKLEKYDIMRIFLVLENLRKKLNKQKFLNYLTGIFTDIKQYKRFMASLGKVDDIFIHEPAFAY